MCIFRAVTDSVSFDSSGLCAFGAREANNDDVALLEICYAYLGPERQIMMTFLC